VDAATRERLGGMFCGWYFRRDEPTRVIDFAAGDVPEDADPVRVRDVASEVMQERLATAGVHPDGTSIWSRISTAVERFRGCGCVILIVPVWNVDGRELLHDGTHRACAVYLLDPPRVELDVLSLGTPDLARPDVQAILRAS
jgi:hypothetical protein